MCLKVLSLNIYPWLATDSLKSIISVSLQHSDHNVSMIESVMRQAAGQQHEMGDLMWSAISDCQESPQRETGISDGIWEGWGERTQLPNNTAARETTTSDAMVGNSCSSLTSSANSIWIRATEYNRRCVCNPSTSQSFPIQLMSDVCGCLGPNWHHSWAILGSIELQLEILMTMSKGMFIEEKCLIYPPSHHAMQYFNHPMKIHTRWSDPNLWLKNFETPEIPGLPGISDNRSSCWTTKRIQGNDHHNHHRQLWIKHQSNRLIDLYIPYICHRPWQRLVHRWLDFEW